MLSCNLWFLHNILELVVSLCCHRIMSYVIDNMCFYRHIKSTVSQYPKVRHSVSCFRYLLSLFKKAESMAFLEKQIIIKTKQNIYK